MSYNGASISINNARFLQNDARGSIVYSSDRYDSAASRVINTYDEYGQPGAGNEGRFQYTGQVWLPELGMYYYKARIYSPTLGRFLQTDPIGYEDNVNLYGYVGNDPINGVDPTGLKQVANCVTVGDTTVCGTGDDDGAPDDAERSNSSLPFGSISSHFPDKDAGDGGDSFCQTIPVGGPPKEHLDRIIQSARRASREAIFPGDASWSLTRHSWTNGKWDIKNLQDGRGNYVYPDREGARNAGNFLFGANARALGFDLYIAQLGADIHSLGSHAWRGAVRGEIVIQPETEDHFIMWGYEYARQDCDSR